METDPRHGVPSCSRLAQLEPDACPAAFAMAKEAKRQGLVPPSGPEADSGTRIHRWLETGDDAGDWQALNHDEQETAARCDTQRLDIVLEWVRGSGENVIHYREYRLGMTRLGIVTGVRPLTVSPFIVTGMADHIAVDTADRRALIVDYKTGRLEVDAARDNAQLRGLAVLASLRWRLTDVRVAVVQPLMGAPTVADYDVHSLALAGEWLENVVKGAMKISLEWGREPDGFLCVRVIGGPPLKTGDHCQYCDARAICPALREVATSAPDAIEMLNVPLADPGHAVRVLTAKALDLSPEELASLLRGRRLRKWFELAIEAAGRIMIGRGDALPGWELRVKAGRRKIEDTAAAVPRLTPLLESADGGPSAALLRCAALRPKGLEEEIQKASGRKSAARYNLTQKDAKQHLKNALGELMDQKSSMVLAQCGMPLEYDEWEEES